MTFQFTTIQTLKSFAGAAIFGLGMDAATIISRHMSDAVWFALREAAGLLFWGVLAGSQSANALIFGHGVFFFGCPMLQLLGSLAHLLGSAL